MFELLFITDMTLALSAMVTALIVAARAGGPVPRLRPWLRITAALAAARLVVAGLILTGGLALADTRLNVQAVLTVLPVAWAVWRPGRISAQVAAAGLLLSSWWLFAPFGPQDTAYVLIGSVLALSVVAGLSVALGGWRRSGSRASRLPWLAAAFLLTPATVLVLGSQASGHDHHAGSISVDQLTGPRDRAADVRLTLTAAHGTVRLASGATVDGLSFNGVSPGPEIRAKKGQLVEVTLVNTDVEQGVTIHWHGVDVPNAEDGVPGVTQDVVRPGDRHVYRFVPNRAGTFWYHTHRDGSETVQRGLFGALIVEEADAYPGIDRAFFTHRWPAGAFGRSDGPERIAAPAGRPVRLRMINSAEKPQRIRVGGTAFTVAAIDGNPVQGPTPLAAGTGVLNAAGGRYDLEFSMPAGPVTVALDRSDAALVLSSGAAADPAPPADGAMFDPLGYGSGGAPAAEAYDRTFDLRLDDGFGFSDGRFGYVSSLINGRLYPAVPTLVVERGQRVRVRIANRSISEHPMHLHGHRVRVLSRNGDPATGSPWWTDTLNVEPGDVFEIAFTADNPGVWMDHCHNFEHGANGMIMHLAYAGVSTPYDSADVPE